MRHAFATVALALAPPVALAAQPNTIAGLDLEVTSVAELTMAGRMGAFPTGRNGLAMDVTVCNTGSVPVTWLEPMDPRHPYFGFLVCRESDGRFEQISDRSFVKHGIGAANVSAPGCGPCTTTGTATLGLNCSDTYRVRANSDRFQLGPADEIDPWLVAWQSVGSHFDRGEPDVGPPMNMDGMRSLSREQVNAMNPVTHRVEVDDAELLVAGASYFYAAEVLVAGEAEALRADNLGSRRVLPSFNGVAWDFIEVGGLMQGSVLHQWSGASVVGAANGADDGRVYVGVRAIGPDARGLWRYEVAVHNRDNARGIASFRMPICPAARVFNPRFRDLDADPSNDWVVSVSGGEIAFLAAANNAIEWNTIYNFGFESDAGPGPGSITLDQARPGPGAGALVMTHSVPTHLRVADLGGACGTAPSLWPAGSPAMPLIPNATFGIQIDGGQPGAGAALFLSASAGNLALSGCVLRTGMPVAAVLGPVVLDPAGSALFALPIPALGALEGADVFVQAPVTAAGGPALGAFELSNGLQVRIGNFRTGCP